MDYHIQRLPSQQDPARQYHLYSHESKLVLVADYGSPWLSGLPNSHVRFGLPSGDLVGIMDLKAPEDMKDGRQHTAYALVLDHAVFAIINKHTIPERLPYYVIEVADILWLALPKEDQPKHYSLYNEVPSDLMVYDEPTQSILPEPIGHVFHAVGEYDYQIVMPSLLPKNPNLIALALTFLIDSD